MVAGLLVPRQPTFSPQGPSLLPPAGPKWGKLIVCSCPTPCPAIAELTGEIRVTLVQIIEYLSQNGLQALLL